MHLRSATFKDRGFIRQILIQHWYHMIMLGFWKWNTPRHKQKTSTSSSTLKSMIHQIITLAIWGKGHWDDWLLTTAFITRSSSAFQNQSRWWHEVEKAVITFSHPALECKLKTLVSAHLINSKSLTRPLQYAPALIHPLEIPRRKMRFIIIYVVGQKITKQIAAGINSLNCCFMGKKKTAFVSCPFRYTS